MTRRFRRSLTAAVTTFALAAAGALAAPAPAAAGSAVDVPGFVTHIGDGDTLDITVAGATQRVRLTGINATELTTYSGNPANWRGECHAVEAAKALYNLTFRRAVRVVAQNSSSMSGSRYRRTVLVYRDGAWRDVSELMLAAGHGLFLANGVEYKPNLRDAKAAQYAALKRRGLFDTDYCGSGPYQSAALSVAVNWDAPGDDSANINGEWVRISNASSYAVPVGGWRVRDSAYRGYLGRGYVLPSWAKVPARGSLTVHVGRGTNSATKLFWGLSTPVFDNATGSPTYIGDGAYLFDPQGDLRAWKQYPCRYAC